MGMNKPETGELGFLEFFQNFRRGRLVGDAAEKMDELMEAMAATGGKGKLVIEFPFSFNKAGQLECSPVVKVTKPAAPVGTSLFFLTDENRLTRRDPNQTDLEDEIALQRERKGG
ncbi:hypothetical protein [Hyphobacterium sp.]|uniref:hypothetical protein n=1 Tax=Hyphobacterium sp. TaxID=2004662 RepID=UPI003BAD2AB9